jgi:hypothetical protein
MPTDYTAASISRYLSILQRSRIRYAAALETNDTNVMLAQNCKIKTCLLLLEELGVCPL